MTRDGGGRRRREILAGLGSGLVVGLAGCGGDGGNGTPTRGSGAGGSGDGGSGGSGGGTPAPTEAEPTEPPTTAQETAAPTATPIPIEQTTLEPAIADRVNEVRKANGVGFLDWDADLHAIARDYCWEMIQNEFFGHTNPNGKDLNDRYQAADYQCAVQGGGGNRGGGECLARVSYDDPPSVQEIAVDVVSRLREDTQAGGMLASYWRVQGIGVVIDPRAANTRVYVVQYFC
ncbi:MAG: CAP domain-containing protein [Halobacteriales archaeon]